jgi:hypothetical protein
LNPWLKWIFIGSALLLVFGMQLRPIYDPDVYVHLRDGRFWLESGLAPGTDPFTYTLEAQPTEKVEWLFRIGLYSLWRWGGWPAVLLSAALLSTLVVAGLGVLLFRQWPNLGMVSLLLGLGILAPGLPSLAPRPQLFTYIFLIASLGLLRVARTLVSTRPRQAALVLAAVAAVAVPWTNLHPGVVVLPVLLAAEWLDAAWSALGRRQPETRVWFWLLTALLPLVLAGIALNPLGFSLYAWVAAGAQNPVWLQTIVEWMPPELSRKPFFFFLLGIAWLAQLLTGAKSKPRDVLLLLLLTYLALQSRRHIGLFVILVLPALASQGRWLWEKWGARFKPLPSTWWRWGLGAGAAAALLLTAWGGLQGKWFRLGESPDDFPFAALQWLEREKPAGRMFSPFHWGGFIGWNTRGARPVFMDGRIPLYPPQVYRDYYDLNYGRPGRMTKLLRQYQIEVLLLSPHTYPSVFSELDLSREWALVYWDHTAEIFIRRGQANASLLAREYRFLDPNSLLFFDPSHPEQALAEAQRAAEEAPQSYLPHFFIGDLQVRSQAFLSARRELKQVIAVVPAYAPALFDLALIATREQSWVEAEAWVRQCLQHATQPPLAAQSHLLLAQILARNPRHWPEARQHARQAKQLDPTLTRADDLLSRLR